MRLKALVTGASGFIGSTLIEELNRRGIEPYALLRASSSTANLQGMQYVRVEGDLGDEEALRRAVRGMDLVFHLAGVVTGPNREYYFRHNAGGTARLAKAVAEENPSLKRLVFVSSMAAGGPARSRAGRFETDPDEPVSAYGESKKEAERELLAYRDRIPISIVRPPLVYGPKDRGVFVLIRTVSRGIMPVLQGASADRKKFYSAIYSEDLCQAIVLAGLVEKSALPSGEVFYVAGEGVHSSSELLGSMAESLGRKPLLTLKVPRFALTGAAAVFSGLGRVTGKTFALNWDKLNEILPDYWVCSNEKAKDRLGFAPRFTLAAGMKKTVEWYKKENWL